ncbi:autotransporter domain-containing protein [Piscirickettsia litoralis]|uniref:Autotransporter domain-containing protein n=1 Tax=Piscirickettsia litoralis TaxID=1891921 RepID=A0ABX3A3B0_9GAMM|nr:autotransporter domain-containing protein [Piscirickettsia litoralis]ODN43352.1 hypothetical protein BGC07_10970 [Piscirickettsia litoralis]
MGNNVTRNGKTNNTPTFKKSLLAASFAVALVGIGTNAHAAASTIVSGSGNIEVVSGATAAAGTQATTITGTGTSTLTGKTIAATVGAVTLTSDDQATQLDVGDTTALTGLLTVADTAGSTQASTINITAAHTGAAAGVISHADTTGDTNINISANTSSANGSDAIASTAAAGSSSKLIVALTGTGTTLTGTGDAGAIQTVGSAIDLTLAANTTVTSAKAATGATIESSTGAITVNNSGAINNTNALDDAITTVVTAAGGNAITGGLVTITNNVTGTIEGVQVSGTAQANSTTGTATTGGITVSANSGTITDLVSSTTGGAGGGTNAGGAATANAVTVTANSGTITNGITSTAVGGLGDGAGARNGGAATGAAITITANNVGANAGNILSRATGGGDGAGGGNGGAATGGLITITQNSGTIGTITTDVAAQAGTAGAGNAGAGTGGNILISANTGTIGAVASTANANVDGGVNTGGDITLTNNAGGTVASVSVSTAGTDGKLTVTNSGTITGVATGGTGSADSLTMSGTSSVGNVTNIETIKVTDGKATFGTVDNTNGDVSLEGSSEGIFSTVGVNVTGTANQSNTIRITNTPSAASKTLDGGTGTGTNLIDLDNVDLTAANTPTLKNFTQMEVANGTKLAANIVSSGNADGLNISKFTLTGGTLDPNSKTVDAATVILKGTLANTALTLGASDQTVTLDGSGNLGQTLDGGSGTNQLISKGTSGVSTVSNFDSIHVQDGTFTLNANVTLTGNKTFTLDQGATLTPGANTINPTTANLNGIITGNNLTFAAGTASTINIGPGFDANDGGTFRSINAESAADSDTVTVTGTSTAADSLRPQLGGFTNVETITTSLFTQLGGSVTTVTSFTNTGTLQLTTGGAGYTLDKLANNGTLDVSSAAANAATITALSGTGDIFFNSQGAAIATPQLTINNSAGYTHAGSVKVFADTSTATATANEQVNLIATNGYTQSSNSLTFQAVPNTVDAGGDATLTITGGAIQLAGTKIIVEKAPQGSNFTDGNIKQFTNNETLAIINASGATSLDDSALNIVSTALLPAKRKDGETGQTVTIVANGESQAIQDVVDPRFSAFANANLDSYSSAATGLTNAQVLSNATLSMTQDELNTFLDQVTPDSSGSNTYGVISALNTFAGSGGVLQNRVTALQGAQLASIPGTGIATGSGAAKHGVWGEVFGGKVEDDGRDGGFGYDANTYGLTMGADTLIGRNFTLGFALAYGKTDVDTQTRQQQSNVKSYLGSLYMGVTVDKFFINGNIAYGLNQYDYTNQITSGVAQTLSAEYNGNVFSANVAAGFNIPLSHALSLTPLGSASYTYVNAEEYTETSSVTTGSAAQTIQQEPVHAIRVGAGVRLAYNMASGDNVFTPSLQLMAYHQTGNRVDSRTVLAGGAGNPDTAGVLVEGVDPDRNILSAQLGLNMKLGQSWMASVSGQYDWESHSSAYSGSVKVRYNF